LDSDTNLSYQGTADVNGQTADVVAISLVPTTDATQAQWYVANIQVLLFADQESGTVSKIQYTNFGETNPDDQQKIEVYFNKYQPVNGISVPFDVITYADGVLASEVVLTSIAFNTGIPDSEFQLPK
jgi:outer membrane lipoprotein-sorting protein